MEIIRVILKERMFFMYDKTAADVAAYIVSKMPNKNISHLKLMRLMYLAEREGIKNFNHLIIIDDFCSYPDTPTLKNTYDASKQISLSKHWKDLLIYSNKKILLKSNINSSNIRGISRENKELIKDIISKYGHFSDGELKYYITQECPEWKRNTSNISIESIVKFLNKPSVVAVHLNNIKSSVEELYA